MTDVPPPLTRLFVDFLAAHRDQYGKPMSAREAARRSGDEQKYETFRLIANGEHSGRIGEDTVAALVRLGLSEREVRRAAGHQVDRSPGPFLLPARANRLTLRQREVIVAVADAILSAAEKDHAPRVPAPRRRGAAPSIEERTAESRSTMDHRRAPSRQVGDRGKKSGAPRRDTGTHGNA